jgi:hypothetical protein
LKLRRSILQSPNSLPLTLSTEEIQNATSRTSMSASKSPAIETLRGYLQGHQLFSLQ